MFSFTKKIIFLSLSVLTFNNLNFCYQISKKNVIKYFDYQQISRNFFTNTNWDFNNIFQEQKSQKIDLKAISLFFYKDKLVNQKNNYDCKIKLNFDYKILLNFINKKAIDLDIFKIFSHIKVQDKEHNPVTLFTLDILYEDILYDLYKSEIRVTLEDFNFISLQMIYVYL